MPRPYGHKDYYVESIGEKKLRRNTLPSFLTMSKHDLYNWENIGQTFVNGLHVTHSKGAYSVSYCVGKGH